MELVEIPPENTFALTLQAENLNPISLCELNTKLSSKCSSDWSKSNLISITTPDGIYILKPQLNVQEGPFEIELIRNPASKFKHKVLDELRTEKTSFDSNWSKLNHHQYMEIFLDPTLNTHIDSLSLNLYPRQYRFAKWSPLLQLFPKQCLLAVITTDYQLLIFRRAPNGWLIEFDLSDEYDKLWLQLKQSKTNDETLSSNEKVDTTTTNDATTTKSDHDLKGNNPSVTFKQTRNDIHSLSFCNVCWKLTKNNQLLLLAATIPGDIVVWQFNHSSTSSSTATTTSTSSNETKSYVGDLKLDIKLILQTNLFYISAMHLFQDLLIVSSQDGQVVLYDLTVNFQQQFSGQDKMAASVKVEDQQVAMDGLKTINLITLPPTATLWHRDNIEVSDFYIQPITDECFRIVMAKATNICWCLIYYTAQKGDQPAKLAISDSFSAIDGKDPEVALHQTPATSLKPAGLRKSVLIAEDGSFFQLEFTDNQQDTIPEFNAIRTGKIDLSRLVPKGLCTSPNGHLITMISHIALQYEPDKITTPTKLVLLPTTNNDKNFINECISRVLNENYLSEMNISSPMDICDVIDYIRSVFPLLNVNQRSELYNTLVECGSKVGYIENKFQAVKLKIIKFLLAKLYAQPTTSNVVDVCGSGPVNNIINNLILLHNIELILQDTLGIKFKSEGDDSDCWLSTEQLVSLHNFYDWLQMDPVERGVVLEKYKDKFEHIFRTRAAQITPELCPICQSKIPFVVAYHGICNNGHKFDRCGRSLIILNLESSSEFVCEHCKRHYMTNLIWPSENLWLCCHCQ